MNQLSTFTILLGLKSTFQISSQGHQGCSSISTSQFPLFKSSFPQLLNYPKKKKNSNSRTRILSFFFWLHDLVFLLDKVWWYTTPLTSQLIRQQVGGFLFDVGLLGPCKSMLRSAENVASMPRTLQSMPRTLQSMPRTAKDIAKHAQELQSKPTHLRFPQKKLQIFFYLRIFLKKMIFYQLIAYLTTIL